MKRNCLWKISVITSPEAEEAVQECLESLLKKPAAIYTDARTARTTVSVYLAKRSEFLRFSLEQRGELLKQLGQMAALGLRVRRPGIRVQVIKPENWAESWKRHFKPFEIGSRLLIKPGWSKRRPRPGQAVVVLDPGLSFGTGQHPTTRFCLEMLVAAREEGSGQSLLDLGTGSGILAIAAAKIGYAPVRALDSDAEAIRVARQNALKNSVLDRICFSHRELRYASRQFSNCFTVVCANLVADLLLEERSRIVNAVVPGGRLAVAGVLRSQFSVIQQSFEACGLKLVRSQAEAEWQSGVFVRLYVPGSLQRSGRASEP
jgi:ribosomal protein L11 methyltransferase